MSWLENFNQRFRLQLQASGPDSSVLGQAIEYSLDHPGKRLRPRFVEESAKLVQLDSKVAEAVAIAIEMVHVFSLVHDDLPCMDNDDLRRGLATTHKKFGEAQGLLAGDALLAMAYETFAKAVHQVSPESFFSAFQYFSECIGRKGMISGQSLEIEFTSSGALSLEQLIHIQKLKTGALFRASVVTPLLLGGVSKSDSLFLQAVSYADAFGFAFQIADDLDDEAQDQAQKVKNVLTFMGKKEAIEAATKGLKNEPLAGHFSNTALLLEVLSRSS
jgi:geranylgeranyl pyrophosphate synthase